MNRLIMDDLIGPFDRLQESTSLSGLTDEARHHTPSNPDSRTVTVVNGALLELYCRRLNSHSYSGII